MVQRNVAPTQEGQALVGNHAFNVGNARGNGSVVLGQENHPNTVFSLSGQRRSGRGGHFAEEGIGHLHQNAGAVAGVGVGTGRAAVAQVIEHLQGFGDDGVGLVALDVGHHADAAGVVFVLRGIQATGLGQFFERVHSRTLFRIKEKPPADRGGKSPVLPGQRGVAAPPEN